MIQLQRSCVIQPSVGAKRLRWVNGQNENNSEGVVAGWRRRRFNSFRVDEFVGTVSQGSSESFRGKLGLMNLT